MQNRQKKTIDGVTLFGEKRKYTFNLLDAETGLKFFHEYSTVIITSAPILKTFIKTEGGEESLNTLEIIRMIPQVFTWDKIKELSSAMLPGSTVEIGDTTYTVGDSGIGEFTLGDPLELYCQLFWSIVANYPKYLGPLVNSSDETE